MNEIREIVAKAVVGKGKKRFCIPTELCPEYEPNSILGCWIINHKFIAKKSDNNVVEVLGSYDVNVWYSHDGNTKTSVVVSRVEYEDDVKIHRTIRECMFESDEVIARTVQQPTCVDARIEESGIVVDVEFELVAEVIGETKMRVSILGPVESVDLDEDEDDEINSIDTNFLGKKGFRTE
ncbi:MAG TPA: outer spore coat protein CotE [Firmicutes bacterium]|nr:outer spore coat protein CotE [Bacillota bacterium]